MGYSYPEGDFKGFEEGTKGCRGYIVLFLERNKTMLSVMALRCKSSNTPLALCNL